MGSISSVIQVLALAAFLVGFAGIAWWSPPARKIAKRAVAI